MSAHCEWVVSNADIRPRIISQKILWMAQRSTELSILLGNTFDNRRYTEQCYALLDRYESAHYPFKAPLNGHLVKIRHLSQDISSLHRDSPLWRVSWKYLALSTFFTFCISVQTFSVKDAWEFLWENNSRKRRQTFCLFPFCVLLRELQNVLQVTLHWALSAGAKIFYTVKKEQKSKQCLQWYHLQHNRKPSNIRDFATDNT